MAVHDLIKEEFIESSLEKVDSESSSLENSDVLISETRVQFFVLTITFMGSWEAIASNLYSVFYNGGPQTLVWGFFVVWAGACAQSASLAELASIQPIAGGMYHWTYALAPESVRRILTWMQGWITWAGWISITVGIGDSSASWITSLIQLNYPDLELKPWLPTLLIWALLLLSTSINLYKFGVLVPWLECFAGFLHIALFFIFSAVLLALAPKQSAAFVFFNRVDSSQTSGWKNDFISWNLGLQTVVWAFVGFDVAVHLAEEVKSPSTTVPRVMFFTNVINGIMAWLFILVLLFSVGDVETALKYPQPMLAVLLHATGSVRAATAMGTLLVFISTCAMITNVASMSRLTWSWARDGALPKYFAYVDAHARVPARAIIFSVAIVAVFCLVNIGSTTALQVFVSLSTLALYISYFIVILIMFMRRFSSNPPKLGQWNLGRLGVPVNAFALLFSAYIIIWLPFPTTLPITAENFNYSSSILAAVILLASGLWVVQRKKWTGPREAIIEIAIRQ